jgi:hypothetical protein
VEAAAAVDAEIFAMDANNGSRQQCLARSPRWRTPLVATKAESRDRQASGVCYL